MPADPVRSRRGGGAAKGPQVVGAGYRRTMGSLKVVRGVRGFVWRLERLNPQIDLGRLEARRLDLEIEGYLRKLLQNNRHFAIVPARAVGQLVVGQHVGFGLLLAQVLEADHRHLGEPQQLPRFQSAVPRYHPVPIVDQNGRVKAERFNAVRDRADLLQGMLSRIAWIRNDGPDGQVGDDSPVRGESRYWNAAGWLSLW
jgi:hypothetical protein